MRYRVPHGGLVLGVPHRIRPRDGLGAIYKPPLGLNLQRDSGASRVAEKTGKERTTGTFYFSMSVVPLQIHHRLALEVRGELDLKCLPSRTVE